MTKTLVIHDSVGYILQQITGSYHIPIGVPFLEIEIPEGKQIKLTDGIGVDVSVTPNQAILEDIPPTQVESLESQVADLTYQLMVKGVL